MTPASTASAIALPPEEAISYLRQKVNVTSQHWTDLWHEAHVRGFTVAGATTDALVADFRAAVAKAIEGGTTLAEFRRDFDAIVAKHGWVHNGAPGWRAQIIYETNLSMAYAAGRYAQMTEPDTLRVYPYWQYQHTSSAHPRPQHLAWVGTTLRADDPWWATHYPPNGWRCRCSVRAVSAAGLRRQGKDGPDPSPPLDMRPWRNPRTGQVVEVPRGVDPGFGYNPGAVWRGEPAAAPPASGAPTPPVGPPVPPAPRAPTEAPTRVPPAPRINLPPVEATSPPGTPPIKPALPLPTASPVPRAPTVPPAEAVGAPHPPSFSEWVDQVAHDPRSAAESRVVGELPNHVLRRLEADGIAPSSPTIELTRAAVRHILRPTKQKAGKAIAVSDVVRIPSILAAPVRILIERVTGNLVYVFDPDPPDPDGRTGKLVVVITVKNERLAGKGVSVISAGLVANYQLVDTARYEEVAQ